MLRLKIGLIVMGLLTVMAVSAVPSFAAFEGKELSGKVANSEITKGGEFVYSAGNVVKCPTTSPTITWSIPTIKSTTQKYKVAWGKECIATIAGTQLKAKISESELEVKSPETGKASYSALKGTNLNATKIEAGPCVITVPVLGNSEREKTEQKSPSLTSFEETVLVNTKGITAETTKGTLCTLALKTTAAELKNVEFSLKGQGQR